VSDDRHRLSFDSVVDAYERSRPGYAPDAVAWLAERLAIEPGRRVLDLAAGTGKLTRQLLPLGAEVVAVEPGDEMRAMLERVVPGAQALAGSAEAIPLPDASVDAITVAQAFHWFQVEEALAEMHRVLRPGGGIALLWNEWDDEDELLHGINQIVESLRPVSRQGDEQQKAFNASLLFDGREEREFRHAESLPADMVVERVSSVSAISAAEPAVRDQALAAVRELVGARVIDFPMITTVVAADRV
jgi:SAM-dependent methyltransferase